MISAYLWLPVIPIPLVLIGVALYRRSSKE